MSLKMLALIFVSFTLGNFQLEIFPPDVPGVAQTGAQIFNLWGDRSADEKDPNTAAGRLLRVGAKPIASTRQPITWQAAGGIAALLCLRSSTDWFFMVGFAGQFSQPRRIQLSADWPGNLVCSLQLALGLGGVIGCGAKAACYASAISTRHRSG